jgi:multiple sugar transport system permease protein
MSGALASSSTKQATGGFLGKIANNQILLGYLFILPSLIGFTLFFAVPALRSVVISFHQWNLLSDAKFVGLDNYNTLLNDQRFWDSLKITVTYVLWNIPLQTVLALGIAIIMDRIHNSSFLRGLFIVPWLLPNVVVGLIFLWILDPTLGILNTLFQSLGLPRQPFVGSPDQIIPTIAGVNIWRHAGYTAILIFAGLKTIPKSLYEAASIDGANGWVQFRRITLPLLRPVMVFVLVTSVIGSFQIFDTIAIMARGSGPAGSARVIIYYIYEQVFQRRINMGVATAACVALFLILVTVTLIQTRYFRAGQSDLADYS